MSNSIAFLSAASWIYSSAGCWEGSGRGLFILWETGLRGLYLIFHGLPIYCLYCGSFFYNSFCSFFVYNPSLLYSLSPLITAGCIFSVRLTHLGELYWVYGTFASFLFNDNFPQASFCIGWRYSSLSDALTILLVTARLTYLEGILGGWVALAEVVYIFICIVLLKIQYVCLNER